MKHRGRTARREKNQSGFILLVIFLMAGAVALMLYRQMPRVAFESERDREQLLIERGEEYVRAIQLYRLDNGGQWPQNLDQLEQTNNKRYLRKRFADPYTGKKEWRLVHTNGQQLTDSLVQKPPLQPGENPSSNSSASNNGKQEPVEINSAALARPSDLTLPGAESFNAPASNIPPPQAFGGQPGNPNQPQFPGQQFPGQQVPGQQIPPPGQPIAGQQFPGQQVPAPGQQFPGQPIDPSQPQIGPPTLVGGQQMPGQQIPGQQFPGQQVPGQQTAGQQFPGQQFPGQQFPGQQIPGQQIPGQQSAGQQFPGQQMPGQGQFPGQQVPGQLTPPGQQANMNIPVGFQMGPNGQLVPAPPGGSAPLPPGVNTNASVGLPGQSPSGLTTVNRIVTNQSPLPVTGPSVLQNNAVGGGGLAGVASTHKGPTIKVYKERSKYQEWEFVVDPAAPIAGMGGAGGVGGVGGRGGQPGGQQGPGGTGAPGGRGGPQGPGGGQSGFTPSGFSGGFGAGPGAGGGGGRGGNPPVPAGGGIGR